MVIIIMCSPFLCRPPVKFRNYVPKDEELRASKIQAAKAPERVFGVDANEQLPQPEADDGEDVVQAVQPKKANWDLQRDVAKARPSRRGCARELRWAAGRRASQTALAQKLEKLERRTQRAMIELAAKEDERRMREAGLAAAAQ